MIEQLMAALERSGVTMTDGQARQMEAYHAILLDWNSRMDLTNVAPEDMALRHYADSLLALGQGDWFPAGASLIDVGSGAGFPGLPIAILRPDMPVCLLDALKKRCGFLMAVRQDLGLSNVTVVHGRAEDAARGVMRGYFDIAAARGLAPLRVLAEYLLPFVKAGGRALCWKGPSLDTEIVEAQNALSILGAQAGQRMKLPLPGFEHYVQVLEKKTDTVAIYPRKAGLPGKNPL